MTTEQSLKDAKASLQFNIKSMKVVNTEALCNFNIDSEKMKIVNYFPHLKPNGDCSQEVSYKVRP